MFYVTPRLSTLFFFYYEMYFFFFFDADSVVFFYLPFSFQRFLSSYF